MAYVVAILVLAISCTSAFASTSTPSGGASLYPRSEVEVSVPLDPLDSTSGRYCGSNGDFNETVCPSSDASPFDFSLSDEGDVDRSASSEEAERKEAEWVHFLGEMKGYSVDVTAFTDDLAHHASSWADVSQEWSYYTSSIYPYNSPLEHSQREVDRYTDDVSSYASALSSFASGFAVTAEEASRLGRSFAASLSSLTGWHDAKAIPGYSSQVSESIAYLSTYASDLAASVGVWYENVDFLRAKDVNVSSHAYSVVDTATYLKTYSSDLALFTSDWAQSAANMDKWTSDWVNYGNCDTQSN